MSVDLEQHTTATVGRTGDDWVGSRPLAAFVLLAFACSWVPWLGALLADSEILFFVGGLGPAVAAAIVAWRVGTLRQWLARLRRWRVPVRYYVFAFGFPVVLYGVPNALMALLGEPVDLSLLSERAPAYAATWVTTVFLGGLEEPGWRGFALPRLLQRYSSVRATLLLGVVWGLWHIPVQPLAIVVTVPLAFFYTWLFNRTGSVLLCILLHASLTPAQDHLNLVPDNATVDLIVLGTLIVAAIGFVVATQGRLGSQERAAVRSGEATAPAHAAGQGGRS